MRMRFDDDEMNLTPEISRALGYQPLDQPRPRRPRTPRARHVVAPQARREEPSGLGVVVTLFAIASLVCLVAAYRANYQATTQSQHQVPQQTVQAPENQAPDAIQVSTPESAPTVPENTAAQVPAQSTVQYAVDVRGQETAENPNIQVNQASEVPEYLPAEYDTGRVTTPLFLVHDMPRGGAVDPRAYYVPANTCLLYERANANGWRRVVSLDGRYLGYAQVYPTVAYEQQRMRPEYLTAVSIIRRIP